ncbi:stage III sporulation protein AG [Clostridium sp. HCP1S3_B4]|uniref:stage III sporulation protein AG n=1 Tax=unclassified Clostridium TaxID=2614128 RepID=UPI0016BB845F|nr:stage III sporulation protein AG [Clostridiales bacterium]MDY2728576.1 stage III sporulation protein AG [Clostridium sp.]NLK23112.1 stage III sporulation protein AG [Clostridiales bacterium]
MNMDKIVKEIKKIIQDKKISNILIVLLILFFVLIVVNFGTSKNDNINKSNSVDEESKSNAVKVSEYEEQQKQELISILKKISGVDDVDVMITFESDEVKVPAYDKTSQNTVTEETDKNGGKRVNNQTNDDTKIVMKNSGSSDEPFILQTNKPKVIGVVVVAKGASDSKIKHNIEVAVSNLYSLDANKVNVYSMK